ncbi:MAG TPA: hypothetical protein GX405_17230 [Rhizobiales bacterium]|nr:hypothetical protein [Hyphomicrobiales bacterium]
MPDSYRSKLERLVRNELDAADFAHRDHVGVAYEALASGDFAEAVQRVHAGIRALAERAGVPEKANATITWAFMSLIAERMDRTQHANAEDFVARNPDLCRSDAIAPWYTTERLRSRLARRVALLPDRTPAP